MMTMMMKALVFSALLGSATALSSGAMLQAKSELEQIKTSVMAQSADLFKLNAIRAGVKHVRSPKPSSLLEGKSKNQVKWEDIEEWHDSFAAVEAEVDFAMVESRQKEFTPEEFEKKLRDLTAATDGSRYIGHPGNRKAAEFIKQACEASGLAVKEHKFDMYPGNMNKQNQHALFLMKAMFDQVGNVACFKKGTDPMLSNETIVVGAHFDSVNWRDSGGAEQNFDNIKLMKPAPGIDDNGSGTAALLMIAKALEQHQSKRSILLVAFNAEEEGLIGSSNFVPEVLKSKEYGELKYALIADEIAFPGRPNLGYDRKAIFETHKKVKGYNVLLDTMAHNTKDANGEIAGFVVNRNGFGSDHMSFLDHNIPAVLLIERDDEWRADQRGHSSEDTIDDLSMEFGASMARLLYRTAIVLASPKTMGGSM